jgi:hypothetical protein
MEKPTKRKAFNFLRSYFDVVNELQNDTDKCNFLMAIINKQFLDEDPEDLSFIVNLCYSSQKHSIEASVKGWKRVSNTDMIGNPSTNPPIDPMTNPPTNPKEVEVKEEVEDEVKGKEKVKGILIDIEKAKENKALPFKFFDSLISLGGEKQLVSDWITVRKLKKLSNTETAFNSFKAELIKSNKTINEVLKECAINSWGGFKADWINKNSIASPTKKRVIS